MPIGLSQQLAHVLQCFTEPMASLAWMQRRVGHRMREEASDAASAFWSVKPVVEIKRPNVKALDWPRQPMDFHVLAAMEAHGLTPAPQADGRTRAPAPLRPHTGLLRVSRSWKPTFTMTRPRCLPATGGSWLDSPDSESAWPASGCIFHAMPRIRPTRWGKDITFLPQ